LGHPVLQSPADGSVPEGTAVTPGMPGFLLDNDNEYALRAAQEPSDEQANACIYQIRHRKEDPHAPPVLKLGGHTKPITCIDWCTHSNICFTGSLDNTISIFTLFRVT